MCAAPAGAAVELNVVPHGQHQPGVPWAGVPGMLPADAQARMYDRLTPLFRNVTDAALEPGAFFKSAALLAPDDRSLITDERVSGRAGGRAVRARVRRDAYGVPHVYSGSRAGLTFGAGWVLAQDRSLLLDRLRFNALAAAIDLPGTPAVGLVLGGYEFRASARAVAEVVRRQTAALRAFGAEGRAVLRDIDVFVAGINHWYTANRAGFAPFTRADVYAMNAFKAQLLGEGGGQEAENALFLDAARDRLGPRGGTEAYEDLRQRSVPESVPTTPRRFGWQTAVRAARPRGLVRLEQGSFRSAAPSLAGVPAPPAAAFREASNVLLVTGRRAAGGRPILVGGPQLGFVFPGLTFEIGLYGPGVRVRGATSAPFPGYMLIGRGERFGWTLTSAGADIVDTYAERLCGGSRVRYVFRGRCRPMQTLRAGVITRGLDRVRVTVRRTVHGPVTGYAREAGTGRLVALAQRRSSFGRETTDQVLFRRLTLGRVRSARDFVGATAASPQTFNAFYASDREIAFVTTGRLPLRPRGVNPDLPVSGEGGFEWRGVLPQARHPQRVNPPGGVLVNWNNKPARGFPAGDGRWSEGAIMRNDLLRGELRRRARHTPASVVGAANAAATRDPRALLWPTVAAVLARGSAPSPLAAATADVLSRWAARGGSWVDADGDGTVDDPGVAAIGAIWTPVTSAALCRRLGARLCARLETRHPRFDAPPSGMYAGWHQYLSRDLRALLGRRMRAPWRLRACGRGSLRRCAAHLWAAIEQGARAQAATQGEDPAAWTRRTATVAFAPLPLLELQWTNRPSGIHQVLSFTP